MRSDSDMLAGWPGFLAAKAMPDHKLAVAIQRGEEVFIGVVSLNGLNVYHKPGTENHATRPIHINMITKGDNFVAISLQAYQELADNYHQVIPAYKHLTVKGKSNE